MLKRSLIATALSCSALLQGENTCCKPQQEAQKICCPPAPKHMRAAVRHIEAGGVGYNHGYTTLEAFLATDPNNWTVMPFLDLRGHAFNTGKFAANVGIGGRSIWGDRVYGFNAYYDYRDGHHKGYSQVSAGLETLGKLWDLRFNGYLPVGGKVSRPYRRSFAGFSGNSLLVAQKFEYAMKGVDGELGFHFGKTSNFDFYAAAGSYYFTGEFGKAAIGVKARVAAYYKDYMTLEISNSYDAVFHDNVQGQLTLSLPFGPKTKSKYRDCNQSSMILARRMVQPVARQEIVVLDNHKKTTAASDFFVFVNNESSSNGTFESPYPTLLLAEQNSNPGDIIYVFAGDGTTTGMDAGITLQDQQKLWGSGISHSLNTNLGTIYIPPFTTLFPEITNTSGNGVDLANNNELSGLSITHASGNGIFGINPGNLSISSSTLASNGSNGIFLGINQEIHNVAIDHITAIDNPLAGIWIEPSGSDTEVNIATSDSLFTGGIYSFFLKGDASLSEAFVVNAALSNNLMNNNFLSLRSISTATTPSTYLLSGNLISGNSGGITTQFISTAPVQFTALGNTIVNSGEVSFSFDNGGDSTFVFSGNTAENSTFDGLTLETSLGRLTATVHDNVFLNNSGTGFVVFAADDFCLDMVGNSSTGNLGNQYFLDNLGGTFNLTPCNVTSVNTGLIITSGTINPITSCSSEIPCP